MSNFIPTGFYIKIEFVEIKDEQRVISHEDHDEIIEAVGISGKIKDIHQMVSAIVTFTDFCKKNNIEFDLIAGIVEDVYLGTKTVLSNSNIASAKNINEAEEMIEKIKFNRDNGVKNEN